MSERLKEIKEVFDIHRMQTFADRKTIAFNREDILWLIQQAERVEELEAMLNIDAPSYKRLVEEHNRYKQALKEIDSFMEHLQHYGFESDDHLWQTRKTVEKALEQENEL